MADITPKTPSEHLQPPAQNESLRGDCIKVNFSEMDFVPWNNSDNVVSSEVETIVPAVKMNLLAVLFLIGGPANVINMAVFYKQGLGDRVNLCVFALAFADELYLVVAMLFYGERLYIQFTRESHTPITSFLINNNLTGFLAFMFISPVLSAIIATERCVCVFNPMKFQNLLRTRTMAVIVVLVYILSCILFFMTAVRYRVGCFYDPESRISFTTSTEGEFYKAHKELIDSLDVFLYVIGVPVIELIVVVSTILTVVKLRQVVEWRSGTSSSISPREVTLTKMLVGNSILFIACTFPAVVIRFSGFVISEMKFGGRYHNFYFTGVLVAEMFTYINGTFNFFLYYAMGSRYRETFWALFRRKPGKA